LPLFFHFSPFCATFLSIPTLRARPYRGFQHFTLPTATSPCWTLPLGPADAPWRGVKGRDWASRCGRKWRGQRTSWSVDLRSALFCLSDRPSLRLDVRCFDNLL